MKIIENNGQTYSNKIATADRQFPSVDALRFLLAFLVVCIHFPTTFYGNVASVIARPAVPLFLMISGYFLYSVDTTKTKARIKRALPQILSIVLWTTLLYLLIGIAQSYFEGDVYAYIRSFLNIKALAGILLFNNNPIAIHIWYLHAYLYVLIIYYFCVELIQKHYKLVIVLCSMLLMIFVVILLYYRIFDDRIYNDHIYIVRNFVFDGFPFFTIGFVLHKITKDKELSFSKCKNVLLFAGMVFFSTTAIIEYNVTGIMSDLYASTPLAALCTFLLVLGNRSMLSATPFPGLGRNHSLNIYLFHYAIGIYLQVFMQRLPVNTISNAISLFKPIIVFAISLVVSIIWNALRKHIRIRA